MKGRPMGRRNWQGERIVLNSDVVEAVHNLRALTRCRCGAEWTERALHRPGTACDHAEDVAILAHVLGVS